MVQYCPMAFGFFDTATTESIPFEDEDEVKTVKPYGGGGVLGLSVDNGGSSIIFTVNTTHRRNQA